MTQKQLGPRCVAGSGGPGIKEAEQASSSQHLAQKSLSCPASRQGEAFRALPVAEQRRHSIHLIMKAGLHRRLKLSVLSNQHPADIEHHRRSKNLYAISFSDLGEAVAWIIKAYGLGFTVLHHRNFAARSGSGHPCEEVGP